MGFMNKRVFIFVFSCLLFKQRSCFIKHIVFRRKKTREEIKQCWYWRLYFYTFRMFVNAEATGFISFEVGLQPDDVFLPPKDIQCYYGPTESD